MGDATMREAGTARFISILKPMRELLLKYRFQAHADEVSELMEIAHSDPKEFEKRIGAGTVWGSAGSIMDAQFTGNVKEPVWETRRDDEKYLSLLVALVDEMKAHDLAHERIERWAEGARKTLEERMPGENS